MPVFKVVTRHSTPYQGIIPDKKYHDPDAVRNVLDYVLDNKKTNQDLYGGFSVNPLLAVDQFEIIARNFGKNFGTHLRHMVMSFGEEEYVDVYTAKCIAYRIAEYYADTYQIVYAVHIDAKHINIHFVMNTVSYRTGKKYGGDRNDYHCFLGHMWSILKEYGLFLKEERDS
ncbi:MAG: relaxase/mobilization nuclease domain-containing protein [Oscillospiraceae bacterium]|nr:relaxase/mobilization nuclease domain-containing protein [Oscillospiraceae bacterium]